VDPEGFAALRTPEGAHLLASLPPYDPDDAIALTARLRRDHDPGLVAAALTTARLRARAAHKFGTDAASMFFTPDGLEQATRARVAAHRASRFAGAGVHRVADLGCGIGGDLRALARAGCHVRGVERDPLTAAVAAANVEALGLTDRAEVHTGDAEGADLTGVDGVFCDPARRGAKGRVFDPDAYVPPWDVLLDLARRTPAAGAKVAPGLPHDRVPEDADTEWVSDDGDVTEAVLWFGGLRDGTGRRATLLPSGATLTAADAPAEVPTGPVGRALYEPDGAVIRAGLVGAVAAAVDGRLLDPTIAYVTADALVSTPFATPYEVRDVLPFGVKRLTAYVREHGIGTLTVKKRGTAVEPEQLRRRLRPSGPHAATFVLTRVAGAQTVLVVARRETR
jgi:SAM-dependent methyltransferase